MEEKVIWLDKFEVPDQWEVTGESPTDRIYASTEKRILVFVPKDLRLEVGGMYRVTMEQDSKKTRKYQRKEFYQKKHTVVRLLAEVNAIPSAWMSELVAGALGANDTAPGKGVQQRYGASEPISFTSPKQISDQLTKMADELGTSRSDLIVTLLAEKLGIDLEGLKNVAAENKADDTDLPQGEPEGG